MMTPRRYVLSTSLILLVFSIVVISFNYLVDPYLVLGGERWRDFNYHKVEINKQPRMSKAYHPLFGEWDTLLVGNSRIELGLDPRHACFREANASVYNLGLPGAGLRTQLEYALNIIYQQPIKRVLLSVDYVDFLVRKGQPAAGDRLKWDTPSGRLRYTLDGSLNPEYRWNNFVDHYRVLFSLDVLISSLNTVVLQNSGQTDRDNHGFNPARDFEQAVEIEGPHALFAQKMNMLDSKYSKGWSLKYTDGSISRDFAILSKFLEIMAERDIQVVMFTNPFHQQFWDMLSKHNLYDAHQEWLVELQFAASGSADVSIWNFSGDSEYIHETVPPQGVKSDALAWFWEPSHYRKALGDLMLDSMLADKCSSRAVFGSRLR